MNAFDLTVNEVKRLTKKKAVRLLFSEQKNVGVLNSKLGGKPYWDGDMPYPKDKNGDGMLLLLQLNLAEIKYKTALPEEGMLQFFISPSSKAESRAIYRKKISDNIKSISGIKTMPKKGFSPVLKECAVSFEETEDFICVNDKDFEWVMKKALKNTETERPKSGSLGKVFTGKGSKLFGNPCFIQSDIRRGKEILLMQLDTDNEFIRWGDCGTGNFFITKDDLKNRDFSKVIYTWECY